MGEGSQIQKSWEAVIDWNDWQHSWYTSVDSSGNGHRLKTIPPTITLGGILGGFVGATIQKTGKCGQTAGPIGSQFCTFNADESGNGHRLEQIGPMRHQGDLFDVGLSRGNFLGFRGVNISSKVWGMP